MSASRVSFIPSTILTTSSAALAGSNGAVTFLNRPFAGQPATLSSTATFKLALSRSSTSGQGTSLQSINIAYSIEENAVNSVGVSLSTQSFGPDSVVTAVPTTPSGFTLTPGNYTGVVSVNTPSYANGADPEYYLLDVTVVVDTSVVTELRINDVELVYQTNSGGDLPTDLNIPGYLNVGSIGPPTNTTAGDSTSVRTFTRQISLNTVGSTTSSPATFLATPAVGSEAYRIGGADGSGLQGGPTRRLLMYGANSIELRGGLNTTTPPSFLAASGADPSVRIANTDASRAILRLIGAASQVGDYLQARDSAGAVLALMDNGGHLGLAGKTNPSNAWVYIGTGTGSVADNSPMGVKVKLDTTASTRPDGIQSNINIVSGAAGSGSVRGVLSRIDLNDQTSTGDTVALWGDVIVSGDNTSRNTWGLNSFVQIGSSSAPGSITYSQGAIGAEIQVANFGSTGNVGGAIHVASAGTQTIRFGLKLNSGGNPMSSGLDGTNNIEHFILSADDTLANGQTGRGPRTNFIYYGPLNADNTPTGSPKFVVTAAGDLTTAVHFQSLSVPTVAAGAAAGASPTISISGTDHGFTVTLTTGTTTTTNATLFTVTFGATWTSSPSVIWAPGNSATAALAVGATPFTSAVSTTTMTFTSGGTALANSTVYIFRFTAMR